MAGMFGIAVDPAGGDAVSGVAVQWSTCNGHVPLSLLRESAERAGLPMEIAGPMCAAYAFPRLVADALPGAPQVPERGFAPGCPAATDWMALLMFCWRRNAEKRCPVAQAKAYVDDLVAHVTGPEKQAARAANYLAEHVSQLPRAENGCSQKRFASMAVARRALAETPGLPVTETFRDLGVDQQVGGRSRAWRREPKLPRSGSAVAPALRCLGRPRCGVPPLPGSSL